MIDRGEEGIEVGSVVEWKCAAEANAEDVEVTLRQQSNRHYPVASDHLLLH